MAVIQDKLIQKMLMRDAGIPTADFVEVEGIVAKALVDFGYPLVQKARRGGYHGRGVTVMKTPDDFPRHLPVPSYVERFVEAEKEIAVLVARSEDGDTRCYPVVEMIFRPGENVLDLLLAPADLADALAAAAKEVAYEMTIVSAHRTPKRLFDYAAGARERGLKVVGVPVKTSSLSGQDSLLSIVQMPAGVRVATVAIDGAKNAGLLAAQIVGAADSTVLDRVARFKRNLEATVLDKVERMARGELT